jgi:hypothetical protein
VASRPHDVRASRGADAHLGATATRVAGQRMIGTMPTQTVAMPAAQHALDCPRRAERHVTAKSAAARIGLRPWRASPPPPVPTGCVRKGCHPQRVPRASGLLHTANCAPNPLKRSPILARSGRDDFGSGPISLQAMRTNSANSANAIQGRSSRPSATLPAAPGSGLAPLLRTPTPGPRGQREHTHRYCAVTRPLCLFRREGGHDVIPSHTVCACTLASASSAQVVLSRTVRWRRLPIRASLGDLPCR